jgi:uroporphyrin-III C-methyltransferase/precorrin-2 dehydrogenase/sirohydrochlorin ferrochelatase
MNEPGSELFPLFLKLRGRAVLLVGGGPVATAKAQSLADAGAALTVVAPALTEPLVELARARGWTVHQRGFASGDVDDVWLVVAAATPDVNRAVAAAAEARRRFVVAVDDPASASAYGAGVVRRAGVTVAISTSGQAPALAGLLREGLEAVLPEDLDAWVGEAARQRTAWRADGTPMSERRPRLLAALNELYRRRSLPELAAEPSAPAVSMGRVALVGAGPGDPDLLTRRGAERLGEADIVFYDALSSEAMRPLAPRARWFYVGKRACRQSIAQDTLNRLLIKEATRGRRVVRLKAGDPFVFGRGGEEALALAQAGIPCEVVPGVSSAVAAAALAGIPVTHRGVASAFTVVSGHHEAVYRPVLAGVPRSGSTIVVLMGLRQRAAIAGALLELGWRPETPAAVVLGAATPESSRFVGTLRDLASASAGEQTGDDDYGRPGVLVIGDAVGVAAEVEQAYARAQAPGRHDGGQGGGAGRATEKGSR